MFKSVFIVFISFVILVNLNAQKLKWLVKPVIEQNKFYYFPEYNSEFIIVENKDGKQGVLKKDGTYLYPPDRFIKVDYIPGNGLMYGWNKDEKSIVFNSKGKVLSKEYDKLNAYHHTNILFTFKNKLRGLIDTLGNVICKPKYKSLQRLKRGLYKGELPDGTIKMINVDESNGLTPIKRREKIKKMRTLVKDRIVFYGEKKGRKGLTPFGFTNNKGDTILRADKYYMVSSLKGYNTIIAIRTNDKRYGAIDRNANIIVPFKFDYIRPFVYVDKYLFAQNDKVFYILDLNGNIVSKYEAKKIYKMRDFPYFKAINNKRYTLLDIHFKPVLKRDFKRISDPFRNNWCVLHDNKLKGFYSFKTGKYTEPQFTKLTVPLIHDVTGVRVKKNFGLFDIHNGNFVTDTIYSKIKKEGNYFIVVKEKLDTVLKDDKSKVRKINNYFVLDSSYNIIYGPVRRKLSRIAADMFAEKINKDTLVMHNYQTGKQEIFNAKKLRFLKNNVSKLDKNAYCFTDELMNETVNTFEYLSSITDGIRIFKKTRKYGLMHGKTIVHIAEFDEIGSINNKIIKVKKNGKWGILQNPYK